MKKMNNKGFSLIELIIVIAIMAVLVAIIAPNLTKYLGSSKKQTDIKNLDEVEAQVKNCISDVTITGGTVSAGTYVIVKSGTGVDVTPTSDIATSMKQSLADANTTSKVTPSNNKIQVKITGAESTGFVVKAKFIS